MRRSLSQVVVLTLVFASPSLLHARIRTGKFVPFLPALDLPGLGAAGALEKSQGMAAEAADDPSTALQAVVRFLQLRPDQVEILQQLLQARQEAVAPLLQAIGEHERRLRELLESGGTPPEVGQVVIELHALQAQVALVQQSFLANWENLLDPEQRQRLEAVRQAARLQPIVPAFRQLQLL